ncbi:AAA family ATPase [Desulfovibrio inopinatus]|uniref:AAA family ATPase n=1 Tax=Desulfovibrio inopinatus TaxID=102109 RepID=UPI00041A689E|nr:AAA family ATPase [Desulfovibrio inopinatus]
MRIVRLELEGFRGIATLALEFDPRVNVFVGVNGSGKTAVLDAIVLMLSWLTARKRHPNAVGKRLREADISNTADFCRLRLEARYGDQIFSWTMVKVRPGCHRPCVRTNLRELNELAKRLRKATNGSGHATKLPLFAAYPVHRTVADVSLGRNLKHPSNLDQPVVNRLTDPPGFRSFFSWLRHYDHALVSGDENGQDSSHPIDPETQRQLLAVHAALAGFLPQLHTTCSSRLKSLGSLQKCGVRLRIEQLSVGEKSLLALVGDLARRLAVADPLEENPLAGRGIVIIDELDLHLHPGWQRMIAPRLLETFPECQFLLSTHSPYVVSHVRPENVFLLWQNENGDVECESPDLSYGQTVERILEDIFSAPARPTEIAGKLRELFLRIERGELDEAGLMLDELTEEIGEDPELLKAHMLIKARARTVR